MVPVLQTRRLLLHPLALADAEQVQRLFANWEVVKYLASYVPWPFPANGAETYYREKALPAMARGEQWNWTLRLKSDPDRIIGSIGLMLGENNNRGFWLGLPWHGQRLMTEACDRVNDYWFETLGFSVLRVRKAIENTASRRISQKQGMRVVATTEIDCVCGRLPGEVYEITAEDWRAGRETSEGT